MASSPSPQHRPAVLCIGVAPGRRQPLGTALASNGLTATWFDDRDLPGPVDLACLEIHALPEAARDTIEHWRTLATRLFVIAPGCKAWTIGERCQVAIAGAQGLCDGLDDSCPGHVAATMATWQRELQQQREAERSDEHLRASLGIVGHSSALRAAWTRLRRAATLSDLPLLLTGETGCGKELMARAAHRLDPRRSSGPWVALNCAAISPALAEAQLFGVERGAYTGAHRDRRGLLRAAEGGVLFLDEVGELGEELQSKLLRALQERRVLPVGGDREVTIDVRIVAATHRDLPARVRAGQFREDLYYRLAVLPVDLPPLRMRREDIPDLIEHILQRMVLPGRPAPAVSNEVREALALCELPGNVRQLENLLAQAAITAGDSQAVGLAHLPPALLRGLAPDPTCEHAPAAPAREPTPTPDVRGTEPLMDIFAAANWKLADIAVRCEREVLVAALARTRGNQSSMARLLGVTPRCIYAKLHKHRLA